MRSFTFVTTCSQPGWIEYAETMVESFDKNFPPEVKLIVYIDFKAPPDRARVEFRQIAQTGMRLEDYHFSLSGLQFALGRAIPYSEHDLANSYDIIWNARKFSFKVFTICHAIRTCDTDVVVWLDADSNIVDRIDYDVIARSIPEYAMVSYLGRSWRYTECGYVGYNMRHPLTAAFAETIVQMYTSGAVFSLKEWHDSYVFDVVRLYFERYFGVRNFNIARYVDDLDHVFLNTELGLYIDHMKGPRKSQGKSRLDDRIVTYKTAEKDPSRADTADDANNNAASPTIEQPVTINTDSRELSVALVGNHVVLTPLAPQQPIDVIIKIDSDIIGSRQVHGTEDVPAGEQRIALPASLYDGVEHDISILERNSRQILATIKFRKSDEPAGTDQRSKIARRPYIYAETEFKAVADLFHCSLLRNEARGDFMDRPETLEHLGYVASAKPARATVGILLFCSTISELWHSPALKQFAGVADLNFELIVVLQSQEACQFARRLLQGSLLNFNIQCVAVDRVLHFIPDQHHLDAIVTIPTGVAVTRELLDKLPAVACGEIPGFSCHVAIAHSAAGSATDIIYNKKYSEWVTAQDTISICLRSEFLQQTRVVSSIAEGMPRFLLEIKISSELPIHAVRLARTVSGTTLDLPPAYGVVTHIRTKDESARKRLERLLPNTLQHLAETTVVGPIGQTSAIGQFCADHGVKVVQAFPFECRLSPFELMDLCLPSQSILMVELDDENTNYAPLETLLSYRSMPGRSSAVAWRSQVPFQAIAAGEADAITAALRRPECGAINAHRSA
ncbi:hypothetical protein [Methylobacterium tarhaniae]